MELAQAIQQTTEFLATYALPFTVLAACAVIGAVLWLLDCV